MQYLHAMSGTNKKASTPECAARSLRAHFLFKRLKIIFDSGRLFIFLQCTYRTGFHSKHHSLKTPSETHRTHLQEWKSRSRHCYCFMGAASYSLYIYIHMCVCVFEDLMPACNYCFWKLERKKLIKQSSLNWRLTASGLPRTCFKKFWWNGSSSLFPLILNWTRFITAH